MARVEGNPRVLGIEPEELATAPTPLQTALAPLETAHPGESGVRLLPSAMRRYVERWPNVEVRLFNPFCCGRDSLLSKYVSSLSDFGRLNHQRERRSGSHRLRARSPPTPS